MFGIKKNEKNEADEIIKSFKETKVDTYNYEIRCTLGQYLCNDYEYYDDFLEIKDVERYGTEEKYKKVILPYFSSGAIEIKEVEY